MMADPGLGAALSRLLGQGPAFSDVHLHEGQPLRVRRGGRLCIEDGEPVSRQALFSLLAEACPDESWEGRLADGGGQCDFSFGLGGARFRCNLHRCGGGGALAMVLRRLDAMAADITDLGLPTSVLEFVERRSGLLLVTGPTGAGKSTTLAALVEHINRSRDGKIVTIEDPIELLHHARRCTIVQREVGSDVASFAQGLRAALRQDPDVILIGEIRDRDTMRTALAAAEAGHLVLSTLHTLSAAKTVDRISDFFPGEEQGLVRSVLASVLVGVIGQVLLPREDGQGRVMAWELMDATPAIASLIREGRAHQIPNAMATGGSSNLQLLNRTLLQLVRARVVGRRAARHASYDPRDFDRESALLAGGHG
ncbi:MAG: PilT/PilU family type 4a pilus ATPase [Pseudomonadota bacterium]|nr:PilT/PilU family type 4a pilus ATPase [Pseudomonadota bacterium]